MALQPSSGPGLPCWGFVTITFLRSWIVSPAPNPQPGGPGLCIYDPPETEWPSYTPRHWVPILVAFYDMHGLQWDCSLIPATTRDWFFLLSINPSRSFEGVRLHYNNYMQSEGTWCDFKISYRRASRRLLWCCAVHYDINRPTFQKRLLSAQSSWWWRQ
jgi:hypothetical protein